MAIICQISTVRGFTDLMGRNYTLNFAYNFGFRYYTFNFPLKQKMTSAGRICINFDQIQLM